MNVSTQAFVFSDSNRYNYFKTPEINNLTGLNQTTTFPGITGKHFRSSNSCKAYICKDGSGVCSHLDAKCTDKTGTEGKDYFLSYQYFAIPGAYIDLDKDWKGLGYPDGNIQMLWKGAPSFGSRLSGSEKPWGTGVDFSTLSPTDTDIAFPELQAYHSLMLQHSYFYNVLNVSSILDPIEPSNDFCLIGSGPFCNQTDPRTSRTAISLEYPITFVVNFPNIQFDPSPNSAFEPPLDQINKGKGKSRQDPVSFDEWTGYGEAFFNGQSTPPSYPNNCTVNKTCASIGETKSTLLAFGTSDDGNWALNDCIVYHEYTHALVFKLVPNLKSFIWLDTGVASDPGAMNEGWADYFAAIHCGAENFRVDTYNGRPRRSMLNQLTCKDLTGEVHADGSMWIGGVWLVRKYIIANQPSINIHAFDRLVLVGISQANNDETFANGYNRILQGMESGLFSPDTIAYAKSIFEKRILNCTRIGTYTTRDTPSFFLPEASITSQNISTLPGQFNLKPRASDWASEIRWTQTFNSPFGRSNVGYARSPLKFYSSTCAIKLGGGNGSSVGAFGCNLREEFANPGQYYIGHGMGTSDLYLKVSHQLPVSINMDSTYFVFWGFVHLVCLN